LVKEAGMSKTQKHQQPSWFSKLSDVILTLPQYVIPQHGLSVIMHALTRSQLRWFKNAFIRFITWKFDVNLSEAAVSDRDFYPSFNAFFTRELRQGIRSVAAGKDVVVSPVDGAVSQIGPIIEQTIVQAKGRSYSVEELLGGDKALAERYDNGQFATIYLSPRDYHRIHMPVAGKLKAMRYVPGKLFSVNPRTARAVPRLFARNERVICVFDTEFGDVVLVLVGAIFVGSMETVWSGQITPPYGKTIENWTYVGDEALSFEKGQEMGRFNMGSTVVMLLPAGMKPFNQEWQPEKKIQLGQAMN
jgi:phosphatidylserine decarboxylase